MKLFLLLVGLSIFIANIGTTDGTVTVTEVPAGHLAELPCLSSDEHHRFMFWQLGDDRKIIGIIGPGNPHNVDKYNYEVLTGKLFIRKYCRSNNLSIAVGAIRSGAGAIRSVMRTDIQLPQLYHQLLKLNSNTVVPTNASTALAARYSGVSTAESGFYKCVSMGVSDNSAINIHVVELIVKKDWEDVWENDFETNLLRGMAAVMVIVVGIAIVLLILTMKRRRQRFFDLEESRENSPARYKENVHSIPTSSVPNAIPEPSAIDNMGLDVDFPKVFQQMQKEQVLP